MEYVYEVIQPRRKDILIAQNPYCEIFSYWKRDNQSYMEILKNYTNVIVNGLYIIDM